MKYRLATKEDMSELAIMRYAQQCEKGVLVNVQREEFIDIVSNFYMCFSEKRWNCWVAVQGEKIISHIFIQTMERIPDFNRIDGKLGYVTNVYTVPEYRNKGIGSRLMKKVIEWSKVQGYEALIVWSAGKATPFYERFGFTNKNKIFELRF